MSYLAFDTSTHTLSVAIGDEGVILAEYTSNLRKDHSSRLMPTIARLMKEFAVEPRDLKGIIVVKGPGSYTGLRIGVSAAKSMAWALNIPLLGVSSLSLIARSCKYFQGHLVPVIDARRGQVYTGLYRYYFGNGSGVLECDDQFQVSKNQHHEWRAYEQDQLVMLDDWLRLLKEKYCDLSSQAPLMFVGNDLPLHRKLIESIIPKSHLCFAGISNLSSRAAELLELGIPLLKSGVYDDAKELAPSYLRLAEAEQNWLDQQNLKL